MADQLVRQIILDFIILACLSIPSLYLLLWYEPYQRGFFEADQSIRLPYQEETVADDVQAIAGFGLVVFTVIIVEFIQDRSGTNVDEKLISGVSIPCWLWDSYNTIGVFSFGAAALQLTSDCTKYVLGRFRPHFYDVCRPVYNKTSPLNSLGYIQEFTCSATTDPVILKETRLSFPSGHAGFGIYSAIFFSCYLEAKWRWRGSKLLRHAVQFAAFLCAWYSSVVRVAENFHHWEDIGFGFLLGSFYAFITFNYVLNLKKKSFAKTKSSPQNTLRSTQEW